MLGAHLYLISENSTGDIIIIIIIISDIPRYFWNSFRTLHEQSGEYAPCMLCVLFFSSPVSSGGRMAQVLNAEMSH